MEAEQKILLYEWIHQVRLLYPRKAVFNPYSDQLTNLGYEVKRKDQLLLCETVKSVTLLNQHSREVEGGKIMSTREDVVNGLQLFLSVVYGLQKPCMQFYHLLGTHFSRGVFSYQDVCLKLKISYSTAKRKLYPLLAFGLVEKTGDKLCGKELMQLGEGLLKNNCEVDKPEDIYQEAFSEWADYSGFIEF